MVSRVKVEEVPRMRWLSRLLGYEVYLKKSEMLLAQMTFLYGDQNPASWRSRLTRENSYDGGG